jgi:hypothetical protein
MNTNINQQLQNLKQIFITLKEEPKNIQNFQQKKLLKDQLVGYSRHPPPN